MIKKIITLAGKDFYEKRKKQAGILPLNEKEIEELVNQEMRKKEEWE